MTTGFTPDVLERLGVARPEPGAQQRPDRLGQSDFLRLMTAQLASQDPFAPMENGEFLGQMAQFSTVTGIESLTRSFESLATTLRQGQTLQAAGLVGRNVLVPAQQGRREAGEPVWGAVDLPQSASNLLVEIQDAGGQTLRRMESGPAASGLTEFVWDGNLADGTPAPPGNYRVVATAEMGGTAQAARVLLDAPVESVSIQPDGSLVLSARGLGQVRFADIRRIG